MAYKESSLWNEKNEIRCLIIMKQLQAEGFPRGRQMELCREMSKITGLDAANISAKVGNYKSVAGINRSGKDKRRTAMVIISRRGSGLFQDCMGVPFWGTKVMTLIWETSRKRMASMESAIS